MRPASTCSVPNSTTGSGPGMVRRAMFYKPQEPGFYSVAAPAGPGCGHPSRGSPEGPVCHPREHYLTLWNRKGFVCLALRHGASLVPVYSFGENDIFRVKAFAPDSWQHHLQEVPGHFSLHLLPRLFSAKSWGLVPLARPITTVGPCLSLLTFCLLFSSLCGFSVLHSIRAMFCKPPETGFYPVPAPARPGCGHPGWGRTRGPVCPPGEHCLTLWNRKGFVRLALRHGFTQVPMYSFGYLNPDIGPRIDENGAFTVKPPAPDSWQHLFQTTFKQLMYFSPCILWGCGLFSAKS
ncbi:hypothetical protein MG293_018440 [Ovis ammon polii]|uniref:Acyltransferase n=1 Tax=Ovis ammon polii TaxID=230172 RepID=A0AAD4Y3D5_OVIAM|nr:hypothetical protein MG293_018440 [Ovis ammon polii]